MAEVGVDRPLLVEALLLFKLLLLVFKSASEIVLVGVPLRGSLTGSFGDDSVCKNATNAWAKLKSNPVASWISDEVRLWCIDLCGVVETLKK